MPRVTVPDGPEHITDRVYALQPAYAEPARMMREAVTYHSVLPERMKEAVRYRIAQINGCLLCQAARTPAAAEAGFTEAMYAQVDRAQDSEEFDAREKLAIEFAELFALDHHRLDDQFFTRLHDLFSESEIVDLTFYTGCYMAFGRLTHVLGLDDSCVLDLARPAAALAH